MRPGGVVAVVAFALGTTGGCAHVSNFTLVHNGGVPSLRGHCSELGVADVNGELRVIPAGSPGCDSVDSVLVPEGSTFALWQIGAASLAGPANANDVSIKVPQLVTGQGSRGLGSGESEKRLSSGESEKRLSSGESEKKLASGQSDKRLGSGESAQGMRSGQSEKRLSSGEGERRLSSGQSDKRLSAGQDSRQLGAGQLDKPVLLIDKQVAGDYTTADRPVTFKISARNVGATPLARVVIVDRLSHLLMPSDSGGAGAQALPDGSTLMIWVLSTPLAPDARTQIEFRAVPR